MRLPSAVGVMADNRLNQHPRQRRQDKEPADAVRVGAERLEDAVYLRALQGKGRLNAEKAETEHPNRAFRQRGQALPRGFLRIVRHEVVLSFFCNKTGFGKHHGWIPIKRGYAVKAHDVELRGSRVV